MSEQYDSFVAQAESLPELLSGSAMRIADDMRLVLPTPDVFGIRQVIFTGSGDSHFAAEAAAMALRHWTGLAVTALPAMEAARYLDSGRPPLAGRNRGMLVVAISSSGEPARVVEATRRLRAMGAMTVGVTANADSRLGRSAEKIIDISIPAAPSAPGTRSYVASLVGGYSLAIRIAEILMCMTMDAANALRAEMAAMGGAVGDAVAAARVACEQGTPDWAQVFAIDCLGSGPSYVSARYAAAKLVEAAGLHAVAQDTEEFHHLNFFVDDPGQVPAIVFAPSSAEALSRQRELTDTLVELGRPAMVLTDDPSIAGVDAVAMPSVREMFAPILHCGPAAIIAAHAARARAVPHYRGHQGPWRGAKGAGLVRNSAILMHGEGT